MKRIFGFLLVLALMLPGCSKSGQVIRFEGSGHHYETLFDDSYFLLDNSTYHQEIALASFANAIGTIEGFKGEYEKHGENLVHLWQKEGFSDIYLNKAFKEKPTVDSIGFGFAWKRIADFNLVAIAIRSGTYEAEWASNLTIGTTGHVQGFSEASETLLGELAPYLSGKNVRGKTKFWLSGYSRGAAVANLTAGTMLQQIESKEFIPSVTTTEKDIYAYCFEPPLCAATSVEEAGRDLYKGIYNLINFNDLVAKLAPYEWGFVHYGTSYYYPDRLTDIRFDYSERRKLVGNYHFAEGGHSFPTYSVDDWNFYDPGEEKSKEKNLPRESLHPSMGRFASQLLREMTSFLLNRDVYGISLQEGMRNLIAALYGYHPNIGEVNLTASLFVDVFFSYSFARNIIAELQSGDAGGAALDFEFFFYLLFNANEKNMEDVKALFDPVFYLLFFTLAPVATRPDLLLQLFSRDNLLQLISPHYTDLNYYFLRSCDTRLYGEDACHLNDGTYQVLHIQTPSSVSIYENGLKQTIFTYDGTKMDSPCLSAEKLSDGSIDIFLPKNGDYTYEIESNSIRLGHMDRFHQEAIVKENMEKKGRF